MKQGTSDSVRQASCPCLLPNLSIPVTNKVKFLRGRDISKYKANLLVNSMASVRETPSTLELCFDVPILLPKKKKKLTPNYNIP